MDFNVLLNRLSRIVIFCALLQTLLIQSADASEKNIRRTQPIPSANLDCHCFSEKLKPQTISQETKSISIVLQIGTNLTAKVLASGPQNHAYIQQIGKAQTALILQNGTQNLLTLDQGN